MAGTEIERLLVRLVGDGTSYENVLNDAVTDSIAAAGRIASQAQESAAQAQMLQESAKHVGAATNAALSQYQKGLGKLEEDLEEGVLSALDFVAANDKLDRALDAVAAAEIAAGKALERENRLMGEGAALTRTLMSAEAAHAQTQAHLGDLYEVGAIDIQTYNKALVQSRNTLPAVQEAARRTQEIQDRLNQEIEEAQGIIAATRTADMRYADELENLQQHLAAGRLDQDQFNRAVAAAKPVVEASTVSMRSMGQGLVTAGQGLKSFGMNYTLFVTAPLTAFLGLSGAAAVKMDSLKRGLKAVSGSTEAMEAQLISLREVAKLPGLGLEEAVQGSINLQAAGFSAELAEKSLKSFGNALATVGKGKAELEGVQLALTQIVAKGKVSAEEINQIAERVPQIRKVMEKAFGTANTEELQKMGLDATQFVETVVDELAKIPKVAGGAQNTLENLGDTVRVALVQVGDVILKALTPVMNRTAVIVEILSKRFEELSPGMQSTLVVVTALVAGVGPLLIMFGGLIVLIGSVVTAVGTLIAAVGLPIAAALAALVVGVVAQGAAILGLITTVMGTSGLAGAWDVVKSAAMTAFEFIDGFLSNFETNAAIAIKFFKDNWLEILANIAMAAGVVWFNMNRNLLVALGIGQALFATWAFTILGTIAALGRQISGLLLHAMASLVTGEKLDFSSIAKSFQTTLEAGASRGIERSKAIITAGSKGFTAPLSGFKSTFDELPAFVFDKALEAGENVTKGVEEGMEKAPLDLKALADAASLKKETDKLIKALSGQVRKLEEASEAEVVLGLKARGASDDVLALVDSLLQQRKSLKLEADIDKYTESMQRALDTVGMTKDEIKLFDLAQRGATEAQLEQATALQQQVAAATNAHKAEIDAAKKAAKEREKDLEAGRKMIEKYKTPVEKLQDQLEELQRLEGLGAFDDSPETFTRAIKKIKDELKEIDENTKFQLKFEYKGIEAGSAEDLAAIREQVLSIRSLGAKSIDKGEIQRAKDLTASVAGIEADPFRSLPTFPEGPLDGFGVAGTDVFGSPLPTDGSSGIEPLKVSNVAADGSADGQPKELTRHTGLLKQLVTNTDPGNQKVLRNANL